MSGSKGYDSRAYVSNAPGAFYVAYTSDFGATGGVGATLTYEASSGSFASETVYVQVTWITANGESLPSAEVGVQVTSAQGAIKVTLPTTPKSGATIAGFRLYSATTSTDEVLVVAANSYTTQATVDGIANAYPIADTVVYLKSQSTSSTTPPVVDASGIQPALPYVASDSSVDYYFIVPNTGSQWKQQKSVDYMRSDGLADPLGIQIGHMDFIQPDYPGTATVVAANAWMVMNGYLFNSGAGGTTATTFIGWSAFNTTKGSTTVDNTVTWVSYGKAGLVRTVISNAYASAATPVAQAYELFQQ